MKPKLVIVATHPIQHFAPIYQRMAENGRIDITVVYLSDAGARTYYDRQFKESLAWDIDLLGGYRNVILRPGLDLARKGLFRMDAPAISSILDEEDPNAVLVYGYTRLVNWRVWWWVRSRKRRLFFCSDSILGRRRSAWRLGVKKVLLPAFFRGVSICLIAGDRNAEYFAYYGVPAERMRVCPLPVDSGRLRNFGGSQASSLRVQKRSELKVQPRDFVVLMCGKLYETKRPFDLLSAVERLRQLGLPVVALFVGSGTLLSKLKLEAQISHFPDAFIFTGFVNQMALPALYAAADALAIPSSEDAHPLVATEAAVFGLPLVVSDEVGCIGPNDVAREGVNALVYRCGDVPALATHLRTLLESPILRHKMACASIDISRTQDVSVAAEAIEMAILDQAV